MKKSLLNVCCISLLLMMGSCGLYKKYESKVTIPTDNYACIKADTTDNLARYSWREMFTDPCLQALIDTALQNNADARTARLNIEQAEISWKTSRLAYLPTLAFSPSATVGHYGSSGMGWGFNLGMTASWQLDIFGAGTTNRMRKAKAAKEYAKDYDQAVRCQLISSVAQLYYQLLGLQRQYEIQTEMVGLYEKTYETVETMYEAGQYTSAAVSQTRAQLESLKAGLIDLEQAMDDVYHSIGQLLDEPLHYVPHKTLADISFPRQLGVGVPADLLQNRPDVRVAERQIEMAYYDVNISKGAMYPSITISAAGGWEQTVMSGLADPKMWFVQGIGSLVQPIFQGGKLRADLKIKKIDQQIAVLNFRRTVIDAGHEVSEAVHAYHASVQKAPHLEAQVTSLHEAVDATQELMINGQATYLEVLTALQDLLKGELAEAENKAAGAQAMVKLYTALGGK